MKKYLLKAVTVFLAIAVVAAWSEDKADEQKVVKDLKAAFAGETTASAKYAAYAEKAKAEGLPRIAVLFEAISKAKDVHASNLKAGLEQLDEPAYAVQPNFEVKSTKENLQDAINEETYRSGRMYPGFIEDSKAAKVSIAQISFEYAYKAELKHKVFYEHALNALENNKVESLAAMYRVCATCGNTYAGEGPARCGVCMTSKDRYITVE